MRWGNKIKISRSSEQTGNLNLNRDVLQRVAGLDLSDRVHEATVFGGRGAYSDVAQGWLKSSERSVPPTKIAIKRLRFHVEPTDMKRLFEKEIYVWSKLEHLNILPLCGYAFEHGTGCPLLISPWMERGTAWKYARDNMDESVLPLVLGIAHGLHYMHSRGVVHSDIKSTNILVSSSNPPEAVICDFGTARMFNPSLSLAKLSSGQKGTSRWLSPELFDGVEGRNYSKESDIWAFGITVYELVTRQLPYKQYNDLQIQGILKDGILPQLPVSLPSEPQYLGCLRKLCEECWNHDVSSRIGTDGILAVLQPFAQNKVCLDHSSETISSGCSGTVPGLLIKNCRAFPRQKQVCQVKFSPNGEWVALGSGRTVQVHNIKSDEFGWILDHGVTEQGSDNGVRNLCFNPDPIVIATGAADRKLRIWERNCLVEDWEIPQETTSLAFSAHGRFLAYGLADGSTHLRKHAYSGMSVTLRIDGTCSPTIGIAFSPTTRFVATSSRDGAVRIWEEQEQRWKLINELKVHSSCEDSIAFVSDAKILVGSGQTIRKWEVSKMAPELTDTSEDSCRHPDDISSIAISNDGKWIVSGSTDKNVRIWSQESGQLVATLTDHTGAIISVDFSPKGGNFVTVDNCGQMILWSYESK